MRDFTAEGLLSFKNHFHELNPVILTLDKEIKASNLANQKKRILKHWWKNVMNGQIYFRGYFRLKQRLKGTKSLLSGYASLDCSRLTDAFESFEWGIYQSSYHYDCIISCNSFQRSLLIRQSRHHCVWWSSGGFWYHIPGFGVVEYI